MNSGMGRVWFSLLFAFVLPSAWAGEGQDHLDRQYRCAFDRMVARLEERNRGLSIEQIAQRIIAEEKEREKLPPPPPPVDPAADPENGGSFRAMGIRGTINPDELIDALIPGDRAKVRDAWVNGLINANQLLELHWICTLTGKPAQEMLDQYAADGGNYGPSSITVAPNGLKQKIIEGEKKPNKPREIRGAHSPTILNDPAKFQIVSQSTNPNGTINVKFKKWVVTPENPEGIWSKPKPSTLAPLNWTEEDVDYAGQITLMHGKFHKSEKREGETVTFLRYPAYRMVEEDLDHKSTKAGTIEWEIIVNDKNEITSSYPTGN